MQADDRILRGWGEIELYTGQSRMTLLRKKYPIHKEYKGSIWASPEEIDRHRRGQSRQVEYKEPSAQN